MAQKNSTPSRKLKKIIKRNNLKPLLYVVIKDQEHTVIVKHRITGAVKVLYK